MWKHARVLGTPAAVAALVAAGLAVTAPATSSAAQASRCGDPAVRPWCDPSLSPDARADLLLPRLTRAEKISLLGGDELTGVMGAEDAHTGTSLGVPRLGIPDMYYSDGPVGTRQGKATGFPSPMTVASTFDPDVARLNASLIADEVKKKGNDVVFAPGVNILRTPVNGRTFEYFGEDPALASAITVGFIEGVQDQGVIANVKHYAVNNQEGIGVVADEGVPIGSVVGSRMTVDARVDERTLREIYLPAFESAVKDAGVGTVMCAYNRVNGEYACENDHLLTEVLKEEWGFDGYVLTDYGAAKSTGESLNSGLDLDIWPGMAYQPLLVEGALLTGEVTMATVNEHVHRILRTMFAFGVFDRPAYVNDTTQIDQDAHHEAAADIEAAGIVLMQNEDQLLPLDEDGLRTLAVIGPEADVIEDGGGSSKIDMFRTTTPLAALRERLGADRVVYDDGSNAARAAGVAAAADAAVVVVGDHMTEGADKLAPTLNSGQTDLIDRDALISAVGAAQPRTVAVLQSGGPVLTPWRDDVPALVEMWYPGQNGGTALARVLFGDVDPGGRLPATFPQRAADLPTAGDPEMYPGVAETVKYKEGVMVGYRHFDAHGIEPAYPFGHGLSYTTFDYGRPTVTRSPGGAGEEVARVSFTVTNTGDRAGTTVPQLYVGMPTPPTGEEQPPRQLKGFDSVDLEPGESARVTLPLDRRDLSYWSTASNGWQVAPGCYTLEVGRSSRDITGTATAGWQADCGVRIS
jgi:beta-glucosidase